MKKIISFLMITAMAVLMTGALVWAHEAPERITVDEPPLSEKGSIMLESYYDIHVRQSDLQVSEVDVENQVSSILAGKHDGETDEEFVKRYASEHLGLEMNTLDELRDYVREDLYHTGLQAAILRELENRIYIDSYPEDAIALLKEYARQELDREVKMYEWAGLEGFDAAKVVEDLGYASEEDFLNAESMYYGKYVMLLDELALQLRITTTDAEVEDAIRELMSFYGYDDEMTLEEYIEMNGSEPWMFMVKKLNVEYHKVLGALEPNAVIEDDETQQQLQEPVTEAVRGKPALAYFTASTLDGGSVTQDLISGKDLTIMNVWATWCGFCLDEMPDLAEYAASLPDNIQLVTYCTDGGDRPDLARQILQDSGLADQDIITITDGTDDFEIIDSQIMYFPSTFFINSKGELMGEPIIGGQADLKAVLDEHVEQALNSAS